MKHATIVTLVALAVATTCPAQVQSDSTARKPAEEDVPKVTVKRLEDRCRIEVDGKLFTEYRWDRVRGPILYPVMGAHGRAMTRNFPIKRGVANEAKDHVHHESLWFTHGAVNGHDFWAGKGRIVQESVETKQSGKAVEITSRNKWVVGDEVICTDTRTVSFHARGSARCIDFDVRIHASETDLVFGDTKEGTMAIRLNPVLRLEGKVAKGRIVNSEGVGDGKAWGKRAKWVAYWGPVEGEVVGLALMDHPENYGHPCRWHARDYGLLTANPWGVYQFERKKEPVAGMKLAKGESVRLRYRFCFFAGDAEKGDVAGEYERFVKGAK